MIVIRVELHSAITGKVTEIGKMHIINDGTSVTHRSGNYDVEVMRKGTTYTVQRRARVEDYPRRSEPVWELVRRALNKAFP